MPVNEDLAVETSSQCDLNGCEELAFASLARYRLCQKHFLSGCRAGFETCADLLKDRSSRNVQLVWQFIVECEKAVFELMQRGNDLRPQERTELVEILLRLEETKRRLRRSVRRTASIPVLLRSESPGRSWEERTETLDLDRHGAKLKCQHPVEIEEIVSLVRVDTGREAKGRVVWCLRKDSQQHEIGVELLGCENYWGLDWTTEDAFCASSAIDLDNSERERPLNISLTAVELGHHARPGRRQAVSIPLRHESEESQDS